MFPLLPKGQCRVSDPYKSKIGSFRVLIKQSFDSLARLGARPCSAYFVPPMPVPYEIETSKVKFNLQ